MGRTPGKAGALLNTPDKQEKRDKASGWVPKKMTKRMWDVFHYVCQNPNATQQTIAKEVGIAQSNLSRMMGSQVFQDEIRNLNRTIVEKRLGMVAESGLDRFKRMFEDDESQDADVVNAMKVLMNATGFSEKAASQTGVNVNIGEQGVSFGVSADQIEAAKKRAAEKQGVVEEAEYTEIKRDEQED